MIRAKYLILKDKQFFELQDGSLRLLGPAVEIAKHLKKEGFELLHIIDHDAERGVETNFDVYDKLTYIINVEVECEKVHFIKRLIALNVRVVVSLPSAINLTEFKDKKRLLVGKIRDSNFDGSIGDVHDIIVERASSSFDLIKKYEKLGKRVIIYKRDFEKKMEPFVFGVID